MLKLLFYANYYPNKYNKNINYGYQYLHLSFNIQAELQVDNKAPNFSLQDQELNLPFT